MIATEEISKNVQALIEKYNKSKKSFDLKCYSKLALIEVCGWIEYAMDTIFDNYKMTSRLTTSAYKKQYTDRKNSSHGFEYNENFKKTLTNTIGLHHTEQLEQRIGQLCLSWDN